MNCHSCQAENDPSATACTQCGAGLVAPTSVVVTVDLSPGVLFHSRYEILGPLGRGGMGMVYKARDRTLDEVVAIKVLRPDFAQDPKMAERFRSEIKLARKVRHRNVCSIHDYGEDQGLLYISMELIEGVDLKRVLKEGPLPPAEAYEVAIQVAEGLHAVHDAGIIHRDLKTPNIMRDSRGVARLMDFGVAKRHGAEGTMTATGHIVGTPEYMSPEQAQGRKLDFRSDVYAMGIVVYELFTGKVPFHGETPISTILKHLHDPPPLEGPAAARLPPALVPVLRKALAKDPDDRHASALDLAEALRQARSPSRRQQPIATAVLEAPTLKPGRVAGARRTLKPWLLILPVAGLGATVFLLTRGSAPPAAPVAAPPQASSASASPPPAMAPMAQPTPLSSTTPSPEPLSAPPAVAAPASSPTPRLAPSPRRTPRIATEPAAPAARPTPAATPAVAPTPAPVPILLAVPPPSPPSAAEAAGLLQVAARPWAEVAVDGKVLGTTPLDKIPLAAGVHSVRFRHPAYQPVDRQVTIRPGQTEKLTVDLATEGVRKP